MSAIPLLQTIPKFCSRCCLAWGAILFHILVVILTATTAVCAIAVL
ncbi:hypothetical protein SIID45300_02269 [Candidatus Magnetaquicoccaceae bacterium FCR-1]|uniref:Uncharacterized protein n=1 Tax=Candidatus Magnetaquiglobus chichijimensis TaxID=3141448 RepID=A0ABQ0CB46_9PROT